MNPNLVCAWCGDPQRFFENDEPTGCCGEMNYCTEEEFEEMLATPPEPCVVDAAGTYIRD